jgi:hypothetical protein
MGILPDELKRLKEIKEMGYFRFVAIFTWTYQEDDMASKRLLQWSKDSQKLALIGKRPAAIY